LLAFRGLWNGLGPDGKEFLRMSAFDQIFGAGFGGQSPADTEMKTRIVKLEGQVAALTAENRQFKENFKKVNELLKECIRRIEGNGTLSKPIQ
jgi:hypothetical protein